MGKLIERKVPEPKIVDDDPENNWKGLVDNARLCVKQGCEIEDDEAILWASARIKELEEQVDDFECEAGYQEQIKMEESER